MSTDTTTPDSRTDQETPEPSPEERRPARVAAFGQRYALIGFWVVMAAVFFAAAPDGVEVGNSLLSIFGQQTPLVFLGMAVVSTMAVGEFDLSFAYIFGLSATAVPALVVLHGWSFPLAAAAALALALVFGLLNALLVVKFGINSVVVTLGVGSIAFGLAGQLSRETTISGMDPMLSNLALSRVLGLPLLFWYGLIVVAAFAYMMTATPLGRHILFVGSNREVAKLAGIPVTLVRVGAYLTSALLCGLAGVVLSAGLGGYDPVSAQTLILPTFASVFLGTVAVVPGRFNPIGMFIAVYFLLTGVFGLQLLQVKPWVTPVFYGSVLVAAVALSALLQRKYRS